MDRTGSKRNSAARPPKRHHVIDDSAGAIPHSSGRKGQEYGLHGHDVLQSTLETKERRLDEQFQRLLERCNKSKEYIDAIHKTTFVEKGHGGSTEQSSVQSQKQSPHYSRDSLIDPAVKEYLSNELRNTGSKLRAGGYADDYGMDEDISNLKKNIFEKMKKPQMAFNDSHDSLDSEIKQGMRDILSNRRPPYRGDSGRKHTQSTSLDQTDGLKSPTTFNAQKSITELKKTLDERERVTDERLIDLRTQNSELKTIMRDYVNKVIELEETIKNREEQIIHYETDLYRVQNENEELRKHEFVVNRTDEEIKLMNNDFKIKLHQQRERIAEMEEQMEQNERRYELILAESGDMKTKISVLKERESNLKERNESLQHEVQELRAELASKDTMVYKLEDIGGKKEGENKGLKELIERLSNDNKQLTARNEELAKINGELEHKNAKHKKRLEEEKGKLAEEKDKQIIKKKEKVKLLKSRLEEMELLANKANEEKKLKITEVERLLGIKTSLERELGKLKEDLHHSNSQISEIRAKAESAKSQSDDLYKEYHVQSDKQEQANHLQVETQKQQVMIRNLEDRLRAREVENEKLEELKAKLKIELKEALEENAKMSEYITKLETQYGYLQHTQEDELGNVEKKIDELSNELIRIKEENSSLRTTQEQNLKEISALKEEKATYKQEYKGLKQINRALEKDIQELNSRLKEVVMERRHELEQQSKENALAKAQQNKLKVLDEIQDMIKHHRTTHKTNKLDFSGML